MSEDITADHLEGTRELAQLATLITLTNDTILVGRELGQVAGVVLLDASS